MAVKAAPAVKIFNDPPFVNASTSPYENQSVLFGLYSIPNTIEVVMEVADAFIAT